jgi:release factor glutamine methyltransferase
MTGPDDEVVYFGSLEIAFDSSVLRPRAWTVEQSLWAADLLSATPAGPVLELCSGAGQIGLLAVADSQRRLLCVDLSAIACHYARRNARVAGMVERVEVREGPMDSVLREDERFALIIADPPWVRRDEVGRHPDDPLVAIDGGDDGLDLARLCLLVARRHLTPGGMVVLQVGSTDQVRRLRGDLADAGLTLLEVRERERGVLMLLDRLRDAVP